MHALESPALAQYIVSFVIKTTHAVHPALKDKAFISFSSEISNLAFGP